MDGVRKLVGERLKAQPTGPHPEAELLAAFTENALLPSERETVVDHLAKCSVCRETIFLALPNPAEMQKVLVPVKRHPRFALRWGTLVAAMAVAAVLIVNRDQDRKPKTFVKAQAHASENTIAKENTPAEFRAMHTASADKTKAAYDEAVNGRPEPKHMTAKPSVAMSFEDSGQVQVSPAANADQKLEAEANRPPGGRDVHTLLPLVPGAAAPQSIGGPVAANQSVGYLAGANPFAKQTALHGAVAGMVVDATGAAIPNAKVSATGPNGTTKSAISKSDGRFDVDQLASGTYSLKVEANGFRTTELSQVAVLDNKPAETRVTLNVGSSAETVAVTAAAPAPTAETAKANETVGTRSTPDAFYGVAPVQAQAETMEVASNKKPKNSRRAADIVTPTVFKWTIGNDGTVQRSADGKKWQTVSVASGTKFQAISSVQLNVWVGGNSGALYHSADSGSHWAQIIPTANGNKLQADVTHIEFSDPQNGALTTSTGQVWTTSDGGRSWQVK